MGRFQKERQCASRLFIYVILVILLTEMYHTKAEKQTDKKDTHVYNRRRRQAGDIILMGYKAQKALKGTTKPSEFFNRIGKKWNGPPSRTSYRPADYYDEYVDMW